MLMGCSFRLQVNLNILFLITENTFLIWICISYWVDFLLLNTVIKMHLFRILPNEQMMANYDKIMVNYEKMWDIYKKVRVNYEKVRVNLEIMVNYEWYA